MLPSSKSDWKLVRLGHSKGVYLTMTAVMLQSSVAASFISMSFSHSLRY